MGFVETGEGSVNIPEMVLTSEAAKKLLEENV
jgi:Glu-tRNA(Gln) amidotransferase subunit E-like FAD-binding protein